MKKLSAFLQKHVDDLLIVGGCGLTVAGLAMVNTAAAMGLAGVEMIVLGVLIGIGGKAK